MHEFVLSVLERPEIHTGLISVVRAVGDEPQLARMLREFFARELFARAAGLLGEGGDDAAYRINLASAQLIGLITARYVVGVEPLASMSPAIVTASVARRMTSYLVDPL